MILVLCTSIYDDYICTKIRKISQSVSELMSGHNFHSEIFKGWIFSVGGVSFFYFLQIV